MEQYSILITGACGVTSRSIVRSLNKSRIFSGKCKFIGTDVCYNEYGVHEGLYEVVYKVPYFNDPHYRTVIEDIIEKHHIEYAFVIPEPEVLYWSANPFPVKFSRIPTDFCQHVISKKTLYDNLQEKPYIPTYQIISRDDMLSSESNITLSYPIWIRDFAEGSTSGKGSFMAHDYNEANAWAIINKGISQFMLSTYLPGRNLACFTLFHNGKLIKYGVAQRMEYVMGKVSASGITGNTSKGKLLNDEKVFNVAYDAVTSIARKTAEPMNGLVVTDLKEDANGNLFVTEINIRHVAFTSTFASAGLNFSEYQMLILTGREHEIPECLTIPFSEDNVMLRDIDGLPIYLEHYQPIQQKS